MSEAYSEVVQTARDYYNSEDADNFYFHVWGGEDIHIGVYRHPDEDIATASRRTVEAMAERATGLGSHAHVLDIGAGYGGAARYLARRFGCRVTALNLSEAENERNRQMNREQGLAQLIDVIDGSFEAIPLDDASCDLVWSQDAILHSARRDKVMSEVARVLGPGGQFLFTDIMQVEGVSKEELQPVLDRIHLDSLGSLQFYRAHAEKNGLGKLDFKDMTEQLVTHYSRVRQALLEQRPQLAGIVSDAYIERMLQGLANWVDAGRRGNIQWGIMSFGKA